MAKRVVISLSVIGILFLLTAFAQKSKLHPTQQLIVYDTEGKKVGIVNGAQFIYSQFLPVVPFKVDGVAFMLNVFRDGFEGFGTVVWESNDCSGTPLITLDSPGFVDPASSFTTVAVGLPGSTVYVENGPARTITVRSFSTSPVPGLDKRFPQPAQCVTSNFVPPWTMVSVPARALIDMNAHFTPPFTVR
jgi:hypothetical protein